MATTSMPREFVVNLHVTERCNFHCTYCFGKWGVAESSDLVFENLPQAEALLTDLAGIFPPGRMTGCDLRVNFVGGEPGLLQALPELVASCRRIGTRMSFVSNGLMLRRFSSRWISDNFDLAGLSIDSVSRITNLRIGRATRSGTTVDIENIHTVVQELKSSGTAVKINTVVSSANVAEDFTEMLKMMRPHKWKVLQMLPVYDERGSVSTEEFNGFIARHAEFADIISSEDNDAMTGSYVMIDPLGRFFWYTGNSGTGYEFSRPILEVGAAQAFSESTFFWEKYDGRYK